VQAKSVNSNAADDVSLAFPAVQQIMTGLSDAATEKVKLAVITKAVFRVLKNKSTTVLIDLKIRSI
jgi:hypothetical protein